MRRALALGLLWLGVGVAAPARAASADALDPHHPGTLLHGRVFHVPQGARLIWEAWEGARGGRIRAVAIDPEQLLDVERAGVDSPADRDGPGVTLVRYVLTVHTDAPADSVVSVHVVGNAGEAQSGAHEHDWDFAFTVHVVLADKYATDPA